MRISDWSSDVCSSDLSSWLYINAVPTSGNAPPAWPTTSNAYWQNMTPPSIASDRSPTPPEELPEGTLWIAPDGHLYTFGTRPWVGADGDEWIGADGAERAEERSGGKEWGRTGR